jgi:hypothetical protein
MVDRTQTPRLIDEPSPCFIRMRIVKGGPFVAARIFRRLGILCGEINGEDAPVERIWCSGDQITEDQYRALLIAPPENAHLPVKLGEMKPIF